MSSVPLSVTMQQIGLTSQRGIAVCSLIRGTQRGEFISSARCLGTQPRDRSRGLLHSRVWWLMLAFGWDLSSSPRGFSTSARSFIFSSLPQSAVASFPRAHLPKGRRSPPQSAYRWNCIWWHLLEIFTLHLLGSMTVYISCLPCLTIQFKDKNIFKFSKSLKIYVSCTLSQETWGERASLYRWVNQGRGRLAMWETRDPT